MSRLFDDFFLNQDRSFAGITAILFTLTYFAHYRVRSAREQLWGQSVLPGGCAVAAFTFI